MLITKNPNKDLTHENCHHLAVSEIMSNSVVVYQHLPAETCQKPCINPWFLRQAQVDSRKFCPHCINIPPKNGGILERGNSPDINLVGQTKPFTNQPPWRTTPIEFVLQTHLWWFPKVGVPAVIIHFSLGFSIINQPFFRKPPYLVVASPFTSHPGIVFTTGDVGSAFRSSCRFCDFAKLCPTRRSTSTASSPWMTLDKSEGGEEPDVPVVRGNKPQLCCVNGVSMVSW